MSVISCKRDTGQSRLLQPAANVMRNKNKETDVLSRPPPPVCDHPKDKIFLSADVLSFNLLYVPPSPSLHIQLCSPLNCDFLPFALNTLLILPFSAPLYHLLSVWALADMVQACDSSGSLFLLSAPQQTAPTRARAFSPWGMLSGMHHPWPHSAFMLLAFQFGSSHSFYSTFVNGAFMVKQLFAGEHIRPGWKIPGSILPQICPHGGGFSCGVSFFFLSLHPAAGGASINVLFASFFWISHMLCPTLVRPLYPQSSPHGKVRYIKSISG